MPNPLHELWPPLSLIRSAFAQEGARGDAPDDAASPSPATPAVVTMPGTADARTTTEDAATQRDANLLLPLTELAQRREAVARRAFPARWAPGRLVSVLHQGRLLGVMLDKCLDGAAIHRSDQRGQRGEVWQGWLAASEADWAGAFDVLLEPQDEPFEPMFGLIQTWNTITLRQTPQLCARVLGEVSATRLAALRTVHEEWATQAALAIAPEPGRIALRTAGGVFSVLSGTPLGPHDPRTQYQALYREVALPLSTPVQVPVQALGESQTPRASIGASSKEGGLDFWQRLGGWFAADRWVRPAFALLALVVVVQNTGLLTPPEDEGEVRFRSAPPISAQLPLPELLVRWKPEARVEETNLLLQAANAELSGGPDAEGRWRVRVTDVVGGLALLAASPLVQSVAPLEGTNPP